MNHNCGLKSTLVLLLALCGSFPGAVAGDDEAVTGVFTSPTLGVTVPAPAYRILPKEDSCKVFSYTLQAKSSYRATYSISTFPAQPISSPQIEFSLRQDGFQVISLDSGRGKNYSFILVEAEGKSGGKDVRGLSMYVPGMKMNLLIT